MDVFIFSMEESNSNTSFYCFPFTLVACQPLWVTKIRLAGVAAT